MNKNDVTQAVLDFSEPGSAREFTSSGLLALDVALGGGWPVKRVSQISGMPATGKTSLVYAAIAAAQREERFSRFMLVSDLSDIDPAYMGRCGIDIDRLIVFPFGDDFSKTARAVSQGSDECLIAVDAVKSTIDARGIKYLLSENSTVLAASHMLSSRVGNSWVTTPYDISSASVCARLRPSGPVIGGIRVNAEITADSYRLPIFRTAGFEVTFGKGANKYQDMLEQGVQAGVISVYGSWYSYKDIKIGMGRDTASAFISTWIPGKREELLSEIKQKLGL